MQLRGNLLGQGGSKQPGPPEIAPPLWTPRSSKSAPLRAKRSNLVTTFEDDYDADSCPRFLRDNRNPSY